MPPGARGNVGFQLMSDTISCLVSKISFNRCVVKSWWCSVPRDKQNPSPALRAAKSMEQVCVRVQHRWLLCRGSALLSLWKQPHKLSCQADVATGKLGSPNSSRSQQAQ